MATPLRFRFWFRTMQGESGTAPGALSFPRLLRKGWDSSNLPSRTGTASFWFKSAQALLLAVAVCFSLGANDSSARYHDLNHRLMCTCGCSQLLGECNHVGCTESGQELAELRTDIASGMSDKDIFSAFSAKYGATVLAAPSTHGFDLVAWIAPFAVFGAALLGTILLIRRWAGIAGAKAQAAALEPPIDDPADRERKEQIRRETGSDGGF
jgi:cytochrome c-type biogenesis protein CcmH/NrfF